MAQEPVQFGGVGQTAAVDIDDRGAFADDLEAILTFDQARYFLQDIIRRAGVLQDGASHGGGDALAGQARLGHNGLDGSAFQQLRVFFQADGRELHQGAGELDRLGSVAVSDQRDGEGIAALIGFELELAILTGGDTGHDGAVFFR